MRAGAANKENRGFVTLFAGATAVLACFDLVGWWAHLPLLTSALPHYATMKPNTALCLAFVAAAIFFSCEGPLDLASKRITALACASAAVLISGATLLEYLTGKSLGIDQLLFRVPMERFGDPPGRMAFGTALAILLTSSAVLLVDALPRISVGLNLTALTISAAGLVGFVLQAGPLANVPWLRSLAVHTAASLLLLQIALLAARPAREPYQTLAQRYRHEGKRRYLLFAVLFLPVLLALPVAAGLHTRLYDAPFAFAFLVVLLMGAQSFLLWNDNMALGRVERKLRENAEESSRILQSIGDAVVVTDADSRVLRMNPIAQMLTGWPLADAKGRPLQEIFPIYSESTGETTENPVDKVRRLGTVVGMANHTVLRSRDGRRIHIDDSSAPILDDEGRLTGVVLVFRNVDERKESESLLRSSENKLVVALEAGRLGSWELNLDTLQMECAALCKANFGRMPNELFTYAELLSSIHNEDLPGVLAALEAAIKQQTIYRAEYRVHWPDKSLHWIIASGQVLLNANGGPQRMVGVTLDVTERHQSAAALIQSEKLAAVGRLASSIAHEINNPLEAVTNLLYLAGASAESAEVKEYIAIAERELQRASVITNQTLRFHKQSTDPQSVTCEELIGSVLAIYQGKTVNAGVKIEKRKRKTAPILCFEGEIRQVMSNLIGNALDAMSSTGGRLLLRSREGTDWRSGERGVVITVADTGGGMSEATIHRIFEPFYTTKGFAGTGLGLWISQEIVQRHQGHLRVRSSQRAGHSGTVFTLFLPLRAASR